MVTLPNPEAVNETNLVEMVRLSFQKLAEINDTSVERDVKLYREVKGLRSDMNQRLGSLDNRVGSLESRVESVEGQITGLRKDTNERFQSLEARVNERFISLENKMDSHLSEQTELLKILVKNTSKD